MFAVASLRFAEASLHLKRAVRAGLAAQLDRRMARFEAKLPLLEAVLGRVDPTLSLHAVRARVVRVVDETADTKTFWLRPNARFGSFQPGANVNVRVEIDGNAIERSYSISSAPRPDSLIAITVKRVAGGRMSNLLADTLRVGHVVELSRAAGRFLLPAAVPPKVLMLSAGSGITPVMSMLRQLIATRANCQITFLHFARTPHDIIFRRELEQIASTHDQVRIALCVESPEPSWTGPSGRVCESLLAEVAPDFRTLDTFLCGPPPFMQAVMQIFERAGADLSKVRYERFNSDFDASAFLEQAQLLRFVRSGAESISNRPRTILEHAESAGVPIQSGCRAGNCGTCRCLKRRGVVVDITTGLASGDGEEFIYPCVSVAQGTVELDL